MGLDSYLYKKSSNIKQLILNELSDESGYEELAYWRKDYLIHEWFCDNFEIENCEYAEITEEELLELVEYIKSNSEDNSEDFEDRKEDIKLLNKIINETDWDNEGVYYYSWW